jgi:hypothetical protein
MLSAVHRRRRQTKAGTVRERMNQVICFRQLLELFRSCSPRRWTRVPHVGVLGLFALGAQFNPWTVVGLATVGIIVGAASVVAVQAARWRLRQTASMNKRLGSLGSLAVEHGPPTVESSQRSDRPIYDSHGDEVGSADSIAADRHSTANEIHHPIAESLTPTGPPTIVVKSSPDPADPADEAVLAGLTAVEMAMLFNRYEHLARNDLQGLADAGRDIEAEIWLDLTQGDTWTHIDTTRSSSEGRWVHLRSGEVICKLRGSDVWICVDDREREPTRPAVAVSLVRVQETTRTELRHPKGESSV